MLIIDYHNIYSSGFCKSYSTNSTFLYLTENINIIRPLNKKTVYQRLKIDNLDKNFLLCFNCLQLYYIYILKILGY